MPRFRDIPQVPQTHYRVDIPLDYLEDWISRFPNLDLNPDFQRAHVWTEIQQISFVEWLLRGGESGRDLHFNHPYWNGKNREKEGYNEFVIVDGKQRLEAVLRFIRNEIPVFGIFNKDFTDRPSLIHVALSVRICCLKSRADVLQWYLDFNSGGTPHTTAEIEKVKILLATEKTI